jgi:hypothetical protein
VTRRGIISYGETELDLTGLEQIVSTSQTNAISAALQSLPSLETAPAFHFTMRYLDGTIDSIGLDMLERATSMFLARPRLLVRVL